MTCFTSLSETKGGQITTSQETGSPMVAAISAARRWASSTVVFIFQLPATMGWRRSDTTLPFELLLAERGHTGERLTLQEFERRAAARGDVRHPVGQAQFFDRRDRIAAADHADGTTLGDGLGNRLG